jgi:hypothetical protein
MPREDEVLRSKGEAAASDIRAGQNLRAWKMALSWTGKRPARTPWQSYCSRVSLALARSEGLQPIEGMLSDGCAFKLAKL